MPDPTRAKKAEQARREARLAQALRDNLRRRKEQARARAADSDECDNKQAPDNEGTNGDAPPA